MSTGPAKLDQAFEVVIERSSVIMDALRLQQGDDGETYGDAKLTGADFIAYYNDLVERQVPVPVPQLDEVGAPVVDEVGQPVMVDGPALMPVRTLDMLRVIAGGKWADKLDAQYRRETAKLVA